MQREINEHLIEIRNKPTPILTSVSIVELITLTFPILIGSFVRAESRGASNDPHIGTCPEEIVWSPL